MFRGGGGLSATPEAGKLLHTVVVCTNIVSEKGKGAPREREREKGKYYSSSTGVGCGATRRREGKGASKRRLAFSLTGQERREEGSLETLQI